MLKKIALIALSLTLMGADYLGGARLQRSEKAMGSFFEITVFQSPLKDAELDAVVGRAFAIIEDLENKLSSYKETSVIGRMNKAKAGESFDLDDDTLAVLEKARWTSEISKGAFDVTVWPLKVLWKEAKEKETLPEKAAIESALPKVGYQYILLDAPAKKASIGKQGVQIDLGAIGKGYAVDKAADFLSKNGVRSGIVNAGGNLKFIGPSVEPDGWRIGIEQPRSLEGYAAVLLADKDVAVSTSGDYQDFFYYKNRRYSHIFDPRTGFPADNRLASVTVLAPDAFTADALSTAFFVLGPEKGFEMIDKLKDKGIEAVAIEEAPGGKLLFSGSDGALRLVKEVHL